MLNPKRDNQTEDQAESKRSGNTNDPHAEHIEEQIEGFRKQLLGMTLRNHLLHCPHGPNIHGQVRIVDELPDLVFERLEAGDEFSFLPLPEPRDQPDDEESDEFLTELRKFKRKSAIYKAAIGQISGGQDKKLEVEGIEREARDHARLSLGMGKWVPEQELDAAGLCRQRGICPDFELPAMSDEDPAQRHSDNALQTLLPNGDLSANLARLRDRARSSIRQTGVATLFASFGFLEWFASDDSDQASLAPLVLVSGELDRKLVRGQYQYRFRRTGESAIANVTLKVYLRQDFGLELPEFGPDDSPESYFEKVNNEICAHRQRWRIRRYLTIGLFTYSKLAIYQDLDRGSWPDGHDPVSHGNIRTLLAQSGVSDIPYAKDREIDADEGAAEAPSLIYDADSSQHSAVTDILSGKNLTIFGPPGTGKSQTIANSIATAMMAGKKVLFVAEKLTALEVVKDRLEKAGLGAFCFNLHAQGLKSGTVRRSLEERVSMQRPGFDPSKFEQQKQAWTTQRDALRTYARVMGTRVGRLNETVHDVLWRTISRKESDAGLPNAVSVLTLADVEEVAPATVKQALKHIEHLTHHESEFRDLVEGGARLPLNGIECADLSPVEVKTAAQSLAEWERRVTELELLLTKTGIDGEAMTIQEADFVCLGAEAVLDMPDALECCEFAALSREEMRVGISRVVNRGIRIREIFDKLRGRFGIGSDDLPRGEHLYELATTANLLGISEHTATEARTEARSLLEQADKRDRINGILGRLANCFGFEGVTPENLITMESAIDLLDGIDNELLLFRNDTLTTQQACRILDRAESESRELRQIRDELNRLFDLNSLPDKQEMERAARALNAATGLLLFDKAAKQAMQLHRSLSKLKGKVSKAKAAEGLRRLINFDDRLVRLAEDEEIRSCLGAAWRGIESDLSLGKRVASWAAEVFERLPGIADGRSEARNLLLHGDIRNLEEIQRIAGDLPEGRRPSPNEPKVSEARERAARLEDAAEGLEGAGLGADKPFASAAGLASLIDELQSLAAEADGDKHIIATVFPEHEPDVETLDRVHLLAESMSRFELSDASWKQVAKFLAGAVSAKSEAPALGQALIAAKEAWKACTDLLQINAEVFLGGGRHETVELGLLRNRAREAMGAEDKLLSWSDYRRARDDVRESHAAPVLAVSDEHGMSSVKLREAYEWALYRSLAARVYHRYPILNQLGSWQLSNYREEFKNLEARLQELERARIAHQLYSRPVETGISFGGPSAFTEKALIQHQLSLKRFSISLREMLRRAGTALHQMKPCFMMSPTSVAELLPRDAEQFDIVIFDEASQMLPCDALGAIARARQAVIVGDPKQLPPATYFQGGNAAAMDDDDEGRILAPMVESILDLSLSAWHPPRFLQWHYRSRHSSLIQFSNARFYDNRLIVFPGPDEDRKGSGVLYHHVAGGLANKGLNVNEAEQVVDAACEFMADPTNRDLSLAIVAMNLRQRDHINELMDQKTTEITAVARYRRRWRNTLYPFIVRNLETVQGDERDVIFISTVYGRERVDGPVMRRFGPITQVGGERRLNVLFSRARQRMEVFSSMQANEIAVDPGISEGVKILRDYLDYAATGRIETGNLTEREPESPFEEYVLERLRNQGLEIDPQVGVGGFRIDLGVKHPDYPHGYLLGVECDGRTYHSALSVRDRDRLREAVLRDLGWDIYRIWSTDWFKDPDQEMKKLMEYIAQRVEAFRTRTSDEDRESVLHGEAVCQQDGQPTGGPESNEDPEDVDTEMLCVEVGDTVWYHEADRQQDVRRVTIIRGKDDPENAIINDSKPLALALLGAEVGETVTVRQPTSERRIVLVRTERPDPVADEQRVTSTPSSSVDGVELDPYQEWRGNAEDPRNTPLARVAEILEEIVAMEGPVLESRAYQTYVRASGIRRLGRQVRSALNKALARLESGNRVIVERAAGSTGYRNTLLRVPNTDRVVIRDIGPRSFDEVPLNELAALIRAVKTSKPGVSTEKIRRDVLEIYGLVRMTAQVKKRFGETMDGGTNKATENSDYNLEILAGEFVADRGRY